MRGSKGGRNNKRRRVTINDQIRVKILKIVKRSQVRKRRFICEKELLEV